MSETKGFRELTLDDLDRILSLTIKYDRSNKIITFLAMLSAATVEDPFHVTFRGPSSSGKTYIANEVAKLFPKENKIQYARVSPTAFWHLVGKYKKKTNSYTLYFTHKIVILSDQRNDDTLESLRAVLSKDDKRQASLVTDKEEKGGLRAKTKYIIGSPVLVSCSANLRMDEQEATRHFVLSPENSPAKTRATVKFRVWRDSDKRRFQRVLDNDPGRQLLIRRVAQVFNAGIEQITIPQEQADQIEAYFLKSRRTLIQRYNRDVERLMDLVKCIALLNFKNRTRNGSTIHSTWDDLFQAMELYTDVEVPQRLGIPPNTYDYYLMVGLALGVASKDAQAQKYKEVFGMPVTEQVLMRGYIRSLIDVGLASFETDPEDRRRILVRFTPPPDDILPRRGRRNIRDKHGRIIGYERLPEIYNHGVG